MSRADGGVDVRAQQRNDASLILGGHSARGLTLLVRDGTRLTRPDALLHDQMIAAEEAAALRARTVTNAGR